LASEDPCSAPEVDVEIWDRDITTVGEALVQLSPPPGVSLAEAVTLTPHTAGAEANVAIAMARLGHRSALVSRLGKDPFGTSTLQKLTSAGVDTSLVVQDPQRPTGIYFKDYDGHHTAMYYYRSASAATAMSAEEVLDRIGRTAALHVTGITPALSRSCADMVSAVVDRAVQAGSLVSFDVNYRPALWSVDEAAEPLLAIARRAHTVFVGQDEAEALWRTARVEEVRRLLPDVPRLVVKRGAAPATSFTDQVVAVPPLPVSVVEPVGAGDAFAAGYLSAVLRGREPRTALRWGHVLAAQTLLSTADHTDPPASETLELAASLGDKDWAQGALLPHLR